MDRFWVIRFRFGRRYVARWETLKVTTCDPSEAGRYKGMPKLTWLGRLFWKPVLRLRADLFES